MDVAHIVWAANLGCLDLNPWPVRRGDVDHPDELRVDLDPQPDVSFEAVRQVALETRSVLEEHGLAGFPKTSGSRGIHVNVPVVARLGFTDVRRAALALARELQRRMPDLATSAWWKEERGARVFVDYNQNARDRTVASAYSVRANRRGSRRRARSTGRRSQTWTLPISRSPPCQNGLRNEATRLRPSTTSAVISGRCSSLAARRRGRWPRRRSVASTFRGARVGADKGGSEQGEGPEGLVRARMQRG